MECGCVSCLRVPPIFFSFFTVLYLVRDKWVAVTIAWRVLRLRMEERPPIWTVTANMLKKQSRTADKGVVLQPGDWARC